MEQSIALLQKEIEKLRKDLLDLTDTIALDIGASFTFQRKKISTLEEDVKNLKDEAKILYKLVDNVFEHFICLDEIRINGKKPYTDEWKEIRRGLKFRERD